MRAVDVSRNRSVADSVKVARSLWARSRGLLGRKSLESGDGLLLKPCSAIHTFGMAFPIDAIFLDREDTVVHLAQRMAPLRMTRYVFRARSVLELPAGTIAEAGVRLGDKLLFED